MYRIYMNKQVFKPNTYEPRHEKTGFLHMPKQRRRSASPEADQRLCFRYTDSTIPLLSIYMNLQHLAIFYGCTARFVSNLVGNPEDRFSHVAAHISTAALRVFAAVLGFCVQSTPKVILRPNLSLKSHLRLEKPGIEPTTPGLQGV